MGGILFTLGIVLALLIIATAMAWFIEYIETTDSTVAKVLLAILMIIISVCLILGGLHFGVKGINC